MPETILRPSPAPRVALPPLPEPAARPARCTCGDDAEDARRATPASPYAVAAKALLLTGLTASAFLACTALILSGMLPSLLAGLALLLPAAAPLAVVGLAILLTQGVEDPDEQGCGGRCDD